MAQGRLHAIAAVLVAASVASCSLLAPSDKELMGGRGGSGSSSGSSSGGSRDGGDAGEGGDSSAAGDAEGSDATDDSPQSDAACSQMEETCGAGAGCCSGLVCLQPTAICVPCVPNGSSCTGTANLCCSGSCVGHTCR